MTETATTTSPAHDLAHAEHGKQAAQKLTRYQRMMARQRTDTAITATKTALIEMGRKHQWAVHLVQPAHTTMDCGACGARAKHRLPLSERTYTCTACGVSRPRDRNSARVMLVRAGLNPDGVEGVRPDRPQGEQAA